MPSEQIVKNPADICTSEWLRTSAIDLELFARQTSTETRLEDWPLAVSVEQQILIYHGDVVSQSTKDKTLKRRLMQEWVRALSTGPGIVVIRDAMHNHGVIDRTNSLFDQIIRQRGSGQ